MNRKQTIRCLSLLVLAAVLMGGGCATPRGSLHLASRYLQSGEYDKAAELLQQELKQHPNRPEIRTLLFRAKLNSYYYHLGLARERRQAEDRAAAGKEYRIALAIFPDNRHLQQELEEYLGGRPPEEKAAKSFVQPPVTLGVDKGSKIDLKLSNIPMTNIFKSLGKSFGVNFIFDKEFRDFLHSVEIENKTFGEILRMLCLVANSQYRVLDHNTVLVYPDQFNKKQQFDLRGIKTFYLSNIKAEDAKKLLMSIFVAAGQQVMIQEESNLNALIIRADYNTLAEIEKFLPNIDLERNETAIDVEILEVNRSLINQLGVDFSNAVFTVGAGLEAPDSKNPAPIRFGDLRNVNFYLTIPSVALSFLETDENNKLIAKPNLRGLDGEEISFMVGDEIPIPETVYAGYAAGGVSTVPVTTYRYRNVGVEIKMKPFVHQNNEVTLKIKLTISFVTSTGVATSFPTLGKREIEAILRLKEGETNIIGGFIRDDVRSSLSGLPALARLPILGQPVRQHPKKYPTDRSDLFHHPARHPQNTG